MAATGMPREARQRKIAALIKRDGLICCFCGGAIAQGLPQNDPGALSIEHVIPRSDGGSMKLDNLKLAHRGCNNHAGGLRSRDLDPVQRASRSDPEDAQTPEWLDIESLPYHGGGNMIRRRDKDGSEKESHAD